MTDVTNALNNAKLTKAAEPIAKPFPIAAVVLPAASNASVLFLTISYGLLPPNVISAIPPALSLIGPYASIVKPTDNVDSMPIAAKDIPYTPARSWLMNIVNAKQTTGSTVDIYPIDNPLIILVAAPVLHDNTNFLTGFLLWDVYYSVDSPITNPLYKTTHTAIHASNLVEVIL